MEKAERTAHQTEREGALEHEENDRTLAPMVLSRPSGETTGSASGGGHTLPIVDEAGEGGSTSGRSRDENHSDNHGYNNRGWQGEGVVGNDGTYEYGQRRTEEEDEGVRWSPPVSPRTPIPVTTAPVTTAPADPSSRPVDPPALPSSDDGYRSSPSWSEKMDGYHRPPSLSEKMMDGYPPDYYPSVTNIPIEDTKSAPTTLDAAANSVSATAPISNPSPTSAPAFTQLNTKTMEMDREKMDMDMREKKRMDADDFKVSVVARVSSS